MYSYSSLKWMSHSDSARCGARDHPEPPKIDIAGDEIRRCLQKMSAGAQTACGRQNLQAPVLVNKPDIGIIDGPVQIIVEASGFLAGWARLERLEPLRAPHSGH